MLILLLLWAALGATLYTIASTHPPVAALSRWAIGMAIVCAVAGLAIRSQPLGEATIMGRLGGAFVRWGFAAGQGKLWAAVILSWLVWMVIGAAAIWAFQYRHDWQPLVITFGWAVQLLLIFYLVGMWLANAGANPAFRTRFLSMAGMVALLLVSSMTLWFRSGGSSRIAVLIAAIPMGMALIYGVFMLVLLLIGGKTRWN